VAATANNNDCNTFQQPNIPNSNYPWLTLLVGLKNTTIVSLLGKATSRPASNQPEAILYLPPACSIQASSTFLSPALGTCSGLYIKYLYKYTK